MKNLGRWMRGIAAVAAMTGMALGGCASAQQKPDAPAPAPAPDQPAAGTPTVPKLAYRPSKDAAAVIEITDSGQVRFFNADTGRNCRPASCARRRSRKSTDRSA